ncbi:type I restriction endonuclease [Paraburkholderia sp. HP33-1]|uniref:type I restriction endonuclease n=1 Tax=Paraburkholderia sp. HP33-1 TaxID=2883243 RepID=UPI001F2AA056|nr:type I restriction enzyme HsdR N-terminal domain-containing protein [Paraburkholderia sp. HP33-1]
MQMSNAHEKSFLVLSRQPLLQRMIPTWEKVSKMIFFEKLQNLAAKIKQQGSSIQTEEATKNAFVMPFINQILGYDVFDPNEVIPEFTADVGIKKGEKVDYAIKNGGEIRILIECKKYGEDLAVTHASQLYRYFSTTSARIAILTNGQCYRFFTDLDAPNKMDEKPFLELDLLDIDEYNIPELSKLTKSDFNVESVINAAGELKYLSQIKKFLQAQFANPDEAFVKFIASQIYEGSVTQKIRDQFMDLTQKAAGQFLNDQVNERLKSAINRSEKSAGAEDRSADENTNLNEGEPEDERRPVSPEELDAYNIIRAIAWSVMDINRLAQRNAQSYSAILSDDNNRKPICRLYFNRSHKYIGVFDGNKKETRFPLANVNEIFGWSEKIKEVCEFYASQGAKEKYSELDAIAA